MTDRASTGRRRGIVRNVVKGKGFAFVTPDDGGPDLFMHSTAMRSGAFETLTVGMRVTFEMRDAAKGPRAEAVDIDT